MSLSKAIKYKKEYRREYGTKGEPYCKLVDSHCRNHGKCFWCYNNRTYKNKQKEKIAKVEIENFYKTGAKNDI